MFEWTEADLWRIGAAMALVAVFAVEFFLSVKWGKWWILPALLGVLTAWFGIETLLSSGWDVLGWAVLLICAAALFVVALVAGGVGMWRRERRGAASGVTRGEKLALRVFIALAVVLVLAFAVVYMALFGNPVSWLLSKNGTEGWLAENCPGEGYEFIRAYWDHKRGGYIVDVADPDSQDKHFTLHTDGLGRVSYTLYSQVKTHGTTFGRMNAEYQNKLANFIWTPQGQSVYWPVNGSLQVKGDIEFTEFRRGEDYGITPETDLELDKDYDLADLGARAGHLNVTVNDETVTPERCARLLLELKTQLDRAGIRFRAVDFTLRESTEYENYIQVLDLRSEEIQEEGLTELVHEIDAAVKAHYAELDGENAP